MKKLNKKGFTLIELLAVIVILAIVAAVTMTVVVPMINEQPKKAVESSVKTMINQVMGACQDTLTSDIMDPSHGTFPSAEAETCSTSTCNIAWGDATDSTKQATLRTTLQAMNISGDMPVVFNATMTKCNITAATVTFKGGQFDGYTVTLASGAYTVTKASN